MSIVSKTRVVAAFAGTMAVAALAAPAASQATIPTGVASATWNVRHSWVNYLTNPVWYAGLGQGSVTRTGGANAPAVDPAGGTTTWGSGYANTPYGYVFSVGSDAGSPRTVALEGGLDFDLSAHGIDISLSDVKVVANGSAEKLQLDASFVPLGGSTQTRNDIVAGNVSSTGAVTLTAAGAEIFNGGENGSYAAGDDFGTVAYAN